MADSISPYNFDMNAAIAAGAQALTSAAGMIYQGEANEKNRKLFRQTRDLQRKWALEDYDRILRDSSPEAQMERLKSAGLNPNLVYGSGNIQTGITAMPRGTDTQIPYRDTHMPDLAMMNVVGNYLSMLQRKEEVNLLKSQVKKTDAETKNVESQTTGQDLQNEINNATKDLQIAQVGANYHQTLTLTSKLNTDMMNSVLTSNSQIQLNNEQMKSLQQARLYQVKEYELREWEVGKNYQLNLRRVAAEESQASAANKQAAASMLRAINEGKLTDAEVGHLVLQDAYDISYREGYDPKDKAQADYWKDRLENKGRSMQYDYPDAVNVFRQSMKDFGRLIPFTNFN